ncbi:hypothetical protein CHLRE_04g223800v5 [Chlamydomonas reinhardtii]|uniref:4a-hydroxytetrahydrobiopterin dehydratase n=1 Tax=Chlamydomonas reinhardtii TaxID=3055 RepID=A0A2K3DUF5_CHLRE|nr:uncharacterized protein CHLRE_04g223800v5 [Chlamydomonas reinhardtii]XP_042925298.1 uncharacterized protein CHLRE_04g223800v5 [Chlamydomonas reinhardtii]PNW84164.1 hypothetical protein CHLRE_04g223800v5 [Chlamydomonas reinhardtii]PNW84165.1 hypothetical protein CHLRE_04g223800v5 [Chlamydomonas reinhardtii]
MSTAVHLNVQGPDAAKLIELASCAGACNKDTPKVEPADLASYMRSLPAWRLNADSTAISRSFVAKNFMAAIAFFNKVAEVAEAQGHHPDLHLRNFREVEVVVSTHAVGGITLPDLALAAMIDGIEVDYSPKWAKAEVERMAAAGADGGSS